jgi:outer membrane usher protein
MSHFKNFEKKLLVFISLFILVRALFAGSDPAILLVNQSENRFLDDLNNIDFEIYEAFRSKLNIPVILPDGISGYLPEKDSSHYLREAENSSYDFILINTFFIDQDIISIESKVYRQRNSELLFNLNSSGSISLGLEGKIDFIINKINQKIDSLIEKKATATDDLFASVFGSQPERNLIIEIPFYINGNYAGSIKIDPADTESILIDYQTLHDALQPIGNDQFMVLLENLRPVETMTTITSLENTGLRFDYNDTELYLAITMSPELKKTEDLPFRKFRKPDEEVLSEQASFSAYLNIFYDQQWAWDSIGENDNHNFPASFNFATALNFRDWILSADYHLNLPYEEELPSISILHDFLPISSRLTIGHYPVDNRGFQTYGVYQGASFRKISGIGSRNTEKETLYHFAIDLPSYVRIFVNGNQVKEANLSPGTYNFTDFPLTGGVNEVRIIIKDSFGNEEEKTKYIPYDPKSLKPGELDYSLSAGIPPYAPELPIITGNILYGFLDFLTGGLNFQTDFTGELAGLNLVFPTVAGTFSLDASQSWSEENQWGFATQLSYSYIPARDSRLPSFGFNGWYKSQSFYPVGSEESTLPDIAELQALVSYNPRGFIQLTPKGSIRFGRDDRGISGSLSLDLNKAFSKALSANLNFNADFADEAEADFTLSLTVRIQNSGKGDSLTIQSNTEQKGTDINWNKSFSGTYDGTFSAGLSGLPFNSDANSSLFGSGKLNLNRFSTSLTATLKRGGDQSFSSLLQSRFSTALVFAGGHFGLSKPVTDSFAIIVPQYNLAGLHIGVNPDNNGYESQSDILGNPVLHNLAPYNLRKINVNITEEDVDIDTEIGESSFTLYPRHKSGTVVYAGTRSDVQIRGTLREPDGGPLALKSGFVESESGASEMFFTDQSGVFRIYGLERGAWILHLNKSGFTHGFEIPEETEKQLDLGDIIVHE